MEMDISDVYYDGYYIGSEQSRFDNTTKAIGIQLAEQFGAIGIYNAKAPNPNVFASTHAQVFPDLPTLLSPACGSQNSFVGFLANQFNDSGDEHTTPKNDQAPLIIVIRSLYGFRVNVQNATAPFFLVPSESYSPYWQSQRFIARSFSYRGQWILKRGVCKQDRQLCHGIRLFA